MSTAAVIASLAEAGTVQVGSAVAETLPWIALGVGLAMLAGRWLLRRGSRVTPFPAEPEVGDDTLEMLRGWDAALERMVRED